MGSSLLAGWDNFYVIAGSAAAALIGLTFVVITLTNAGVRRVTATSLRAFVTPTIVHFGAVLAFAAFLSMPHQTTLSLSVALGAGGGGGLIYMGLVAVAIIAMKSDYAPVNEDWIWNAILPTIAYGALLAGAVLVWYRPSAALYGIAATLVLLMVIGIHNAWDIAAWHTLRRQKETP